MGLKRECSYDSTSVNDVAFVEIIDCIKDLLDCLGSILFCELAIFADSVKELPTNG